MSHSLFKKQVIADELAGILPEFNLETIPASKSKYAKYVVLWREQGKVAGTEVIETIEFAVTYYSDFSQSYIKSKIRFLPGEKTVEWFCRPVKDKGFVETYTAPGLHCLDAINNVVGKMSDDRLASDEVYALKA